jgi:GntR family transcriptional regulator
LNTLQLSIQIDHRSGVPIYVQIMEQVRQQVTSGKLQSGDQLPTVRQLATELRVNFNTVARSYRLLDEAGLISTQQGRGTYIWEMPSAQVVERLRHESLQGLTRHYLHEAQRLGFSQPEVKVEFDEQLSLWKARDDLADE